MSKIFLLCLCVVAFSAQAQSRHPSFTDSWQFSIGVLAQKNDIGVSSTEIGSQKFYIDLGDLGLDDANTIPRFGARWQFKEKWSMNFDYSDFDLSGTRKIETSFEYDGQVYPVNATIRSDLDASFYIASLDYAFSQTETTEWGLGVGLYAIDISAGFRARLNDAPLDSSDEKFTAPLPNIRLTVRHAFSPKLMGKFGVNWLSASYDEYSGDLLVGVAALDYRFANRWTIGLSYQIINIDVEVDRSRKEEEYDVELKGFALTLKYGLP